VGVLVGGAWVGFGPGVEVGLPGDGDGEGQTGVAVGVGSRGGKVAVGAMVMVGGTRVVVLAGVNVGWNGGVVELIGVGEIPGRLVAVLFAIGAGGDVACRVISGRDVKGSDLGVGVGVAGKREMVKPGLASTSAGVTCSRAISVAA
jgi:hypothetical protein